MSSQARSRCPIRIRNIEELANKTEVPGREIDALMDWFQKRRFYLYEAAERVNGARPEAHRAVPDGVVGGCA